MTFSDSPYTARDPARGRRAGIAMIYQELTLCPHLTVAENILLGTERGALSAARVPVERIRDVLAWMGHGDLDPATRVGDLSINLQQVVEIARALFSDARLIVMDEPTSSLTAGETRSLFSVIRRLRDRGVAVIYITHFLDEVREVCDSFTVLRDGVTVGSGAVAGVNVARLIEMMVGRKLSDVYPREQRAPGEVLLEVQGLAGRVLPRSVSLTLRRGEILGIAGLVGSGRSETVRALFGIQPVHGGEVRLRGGRGVRAAWITSGRALELGLDLLSENRKEEGLAQSLSIASNVTLSGVRRYRRFGLLRLAGESAAAAEWCGRLAVKHAGVGQAVATLSGGNQQKVALARLLHHDSDVLFLDDPTRGIDVGSKWEIYRIINALAGRGKGLVMISSFLPELMGMCDTIAVMHRGMLSGVRPVREWTEHEIMAYATSGRCAEEAA